MVELVFFIIKATDQRADSAAAWVQRNKRALHFGQLRDLPGVLGCFGDPDQGATAQLDVGRRLVRQSRLGRFEAIARDFYRFTVLPNRHNLLRPCLQNHSRHHVIVVRAFCQCIVNRIFGILGVCGEVDEAFRAAIDLPTLKVHDAFTQRLVSHCLVRRAQRGEDIQATGIGLITVLAEDQLTHGFCHKLSMHPAGVRA